MSDNKLISKFHELFKFNKTLYYRILIIVLIFTCLPTTLLGTSMYFWGGYYVENQAMQSYEKQLQSATDKMESHLSSFEIYASQWVMNTVFINQLCKIRSLKDSNEINDLYKTLVTIKLSNPLFDNVFVYMDKPGLVFTSSPTVRGLQEGELQNQFRSFLKREQSFFWINSLKNTMEGDLSPSLSLVGNLSYIDEACSGLIIFQLNQAELDRLLRDLTPSDNGVSFLLHGNGDWISSPEQKIAEDSNLIHSLKNSILQRIDKNSDSFAFSWKDGKYSVNFAKIRLTGTKLVYVTIVPLSSILSPVEFMTKIVFFISGICLLTAIFLSWMSSRRLYKPIQYLSNIFRGDRDHEFPSDTGDEIQFIEQKWKHLLNESRYLQNRLDESLPSLREGFLLKLVQGHFYSLSEHELLKRMERFGWGVGSKGFGIMLFQLSGLSDSSSNFSHGDEQLVTFAVSNIVEEFTQNRLDQIGVINMQDLYVAVLFSFEQSDSREQVKKELYSISTEAIYLIHSLLKIDVTVCLGKLVSSIKDIPQVLEESRQASRYRDLQTRNQVIDMDELFPLLSDSVYYPFDTENEIVQAVRMGIQVDAINKVNQFLNQLVQNTAKEFQVQQGMLQLLGSVQHAILQTGINPSQLYGGVNLYEQLCQLHEPMEMQKWFISRVLEPYFKEFLESQSLQPHQIAEKAVAIINKEYMNDIFSLESCADMLGTKPYTLSKVFKQVTGVNFIDYLTEFRLNKAKELLVTTNSKINDIALQVGYQNSYMFRLFKKYEGMTPGEYREKHMKLK